MFWLPLILGLFGGNLFGSTVGAGGDIELFGKDFEEGSVNQAGGGLGSLLTGGVGGMALMLMLMSMNSQSRDSGSQSPTVIVVEDDDND